MNLKKQWKDRQLIFPVIVLVLCMCTAFFFCCEKAGFHEDEYYTYYSTSRSTGFFVEDGKWMPREEIAREYTVMPGEGFNYGLVKLVQSWDVHPPMHYFAVHTMESLFPATLSKWAGLSVNLIFFFFDLLLLYCLAYKVLKRTTEQITEKELGALSALVMALYGLSAASLSAVLLIRMYVMLLAFILWAAIIHVRGLEQERLEIKTFYLPLAICTFFGFMTQYYYFIFLFFMASVFCLYRFIRFRKWDEIMKYGGLMVVVFGLAYLYYPAYPSHMFSGQRGGQATSNFLDLKDLFDRMRFFGGLIDKLLFAKCAFIFMGAAVVLLCVSVVKKKEKAFLFFLSDISLWLLFFTLVGFFLVVSKTGLMVGDAAIRYMIPICPFLVLLVVATLQKNCRELPHMKGIVCGLFLAWLLLIVLGIRNKEVLFLYPEDALKIESARGWAQEKIPVAYAYDSVQTWCIWDSSDELLEYEEVYLFEENKENITLDAKIKEADQLVLYVSTVGDAQVCLAKILKECPNLSAYELKFEDNFCNVYYLQ